MELHHPHSSATLITRANLVSEVDPEFVEKLLSSLHEDDLNSSLNDVHGAFRFLSSVKGDLAKQNSI